MNADTVLILGGAGFLGRTLANRLSHQGRRVHIVSRRPCDVEKENIAVTSCTVDDRAIIEPLIDESSTLVYLASDSTPAQNTLSPSTEADANLMPLLRCIELFRGRPDLHFIYASSGGTIYGNPHQVPVSENQPGAPVSFHGANKLAAENFLRAATEQFSLSTTIIRPSNIYGPGQSYKAHFGLIRKVLEHARREVPIEIWGEGENIRDYLFIDDLTEAVMRLIGSPPKASNIDLLNVGYGQGFSINQICDTVETVTGENLEKRYFPSRSVDVKEIVLDIGKIQKLTGWEPKTDLETGVRQTWTWLRQKSD